LITVGVAGHYSNRPDLLQQLRRVAAIVSDGGQGDGIAAEVTAESMVRSRRLRDRFSSDELQTMIDLYKSGTTAKQVAEKFGISLRSIKRLLRQHGVRREGFTPTCSLTDFRRVGA
jgi:DNA invertase Pin-like site-specific DNA recombinase